MPLVKLASPDGRTFKYDLVEPIPFLQKQDARIVSMAGTFSVLQAISVMASTTSFQ